MTVHMPEGSPGICQSFRLWGPVVYFAPCLQIALSLSLLAKTSSSLSGPISPAHSVLPLFDLANNRHAILQAQVRLAQHAAAWAFLYAFSVHRGSLKHYSVSLRLQSGYVSKRVRLLYRGCTPSLSQTCPAIEQG